MNDESPATVNLYHLEGMPENWPTAFMAVSFWEELGRTVATFGVLEDVAKKAIFALSGTRKVEADDPKKAYDEWINFMKKIASNPLGSLIRVYGREMKAHPELRTSNPEDLLDDLEWALRVRNAICHGTWQHPEEQGVSVPHFVDRFGKVWIEGMNEKYFRETRAATEQIIIGIVNTVQAMGYQFPGLKGPGKPIWPQP